MNDIHVPPIMTDDMKLQAEKAARTKRKDEMQIDNILEKRGKRYGAFRTHAKISQSLLDLMREYVIEIKDYEECESGNYRPKVWDKLKPYQREALGMICNKLGRILNGDPNYADSWADIAGYAQLVAKELEGVGV